MSNIVDNKNLQSDKFWADDLSVLYNKDRLVEFFPTSKMTMVEKLNSITRLGIYLGVILAILMRNYLYLYITVVVVAITFFIYKFQEDNLELYYDGVNDMRSKNNKDKLQEKDCTKPTVDNPLMNFNIISDKRDRSKACDSFDNKKVRDEIEDKFGYNLYRDVGDLYGKNNSQRQYYTMPSTTMPNDQTAFAKWCYNTGPTCKEKGLYCAPIYSPMKDTNNPYQNVPQQF
jgi:hypothetical protein